MPFRVLTTIDDLGYKNIILFREGNLHAPVAVLGYYEWRDLNVNVERGFADLKADQITELQAEVKELKAQRVNLINMKADLEKQNRNLSSELVEANKRVEIALNSYE